MKYYLGETFDKEKNKEYKKLDSGQKAAEREGLKLFDENGVDVTLQGKTPAPEAIDAPEESTTEVEVAATFAENGQEGAKTEATDTPEDGVKEVHGKIRRIFDGAVRIRRSPSWAASAEAGVSKFTEKDVKALHIVDGKPMYATTDGFFISGAADIVEFIEE